ncbi:FxsA domain protein [Natronomonas moolapensis 8.8.11]|uniref:FxsA domain protein n=1 Tax=Natronomonas moolapensis (strain DSM 18674 / CECT 7526 / JCM 14361 / 8.8.11) TaxID=268739 RepID=M1Y1M4_NATM8|nr:FxsA family protein [Natronomonas moolapensis]CCQ36376.1 FxsA domain protein [Natronomonas moolapensis 8.8.11]
MYLRLIGIALLVPLADVLLLVVLATGLGPVTIGPAATVAVVVLTALIGLLLVRAEGRHTIRKIQRKLARGDPPTDELLDGALLLVAGALMLTPGLVTDLLGLVLVLPPTRYPIRLVVKRYVVKPYIDDKTDGFASGNVYIGGFPGGDGDASGFGGGFGGQSPGPGPGPGPDTDAGAADYDGETVEMGEEDYEFEDVSGTDDGDDGASRDR